MKNFARPTNQKRRLPVRSNSGQISIAPMTLTTALACLAVFVAVCITINDDHNGTKAQLTPSTIEEQGTAIKTDATEANRPQRRRDGSRQIDTQTPTLEGDSLESLMLEKAHQIRSHRAKGVQIAMGGRSVEG